MDKGSRSLGPWGLDPGTVSRGNSSEKFDFLKCLACSLGHGTEGILCDVNRKSGFLGNQLVKAAQQGTATGKNHPSIDKIRREFGRTAFERDPDSLNNTRNRLIERIADFLGRPATRSRPFTSIVSSFSRG